MEAFDLIVIGSGSAGSSAVEAAHARGAKVCIIERDAIGGECPNYACVPAKAMLKSAKLYHQTKYGLSKYGIHASKVRFSFSEIMKRKEDVVNTITGKGKRLKKMWEGMGVKVVKGSAHFIDKHTVRVGSKEYSAKAFIIATGASDFIPPIEGIGAIPYLDYRGITTLKRQPKSLVIIGGGPVGCEFATFFSLLGTKVTVIQLAPHLLHREEEEVSILVEKAMKEQGVNICTQAKALAVKQVSGGVQVTYQVKMGRRKTMKVDKVVLAAGKRANIDGLNLKAAGVKVDAKGRVKISEALQTSTKHIFVAGDVAGGMRFTHMAHQEGEIAGHNAMQVLSKKRGLQKRDMRVVPRVTFTLPEVASVGMTSKEAAAAKIPVVVGSFPLGALGRAVTEGERTGFVKLIVDKKTRLILGGHVIGTAAGELVHEIALAMQMGVTVDDLAAMTHAFPTWSEGVLAAASNV